MPKNTYQLVRKCAILKCSLSADNDSATPFFSLWLLAHYKWINMEMLQNYVNQHMNEDKYH